jgi:hypothetical protein
MLWLRLQCECDFSAAVSPVHTAYHWPAQLLTLYTHASYQGKPSQQRSYTP